jgi:hypothetical protein
MKQNTYIFRSGIKDCPICEEKFRYRANLDQHMRLVHGQKVFNYAKPAKVGLKIKDNGDYE